jgi:2-oxoacid:acceptor oxidoreductase gamma subunit (pyruvate/2-ketoisovalerate family)
MIEAIFYGRGGQGAVTAAQLLAEAAIHSGNFHDCSSFPSFGAERRGAPVEAYCRISDQAIWTRCAIQSADIAIVLDETHFGQHVIDKLKPQFNLVINTTRKASDFLKKYNFKGKTGEIATADVTQICLDTELLLEGQPVVNTPILGVMSRVIPQIPIEHFVEAIQWRFGTGKTAQKNIDAAKIAADVTCVTKVAQ